MCNLGLRVLRCLLCRLRFFVCITRISAMEDTGDNNTTDAWAIDVEVNFCIKGKSKTYRFVGGAGSSNWVVQDYNNTVDFL